MSLQALRRSINDSGWPLWPARSFSFIINAAMTIGVFSTFGNRASFSLRGNKVTVVKSTAEPVSNNAHTYRQISQQ